MAIGSQTQLPAPIQPEPIPLTLVRPVCIKPCTSKPTRNFFTVFSMDEDNDDEEELARREIWDIMHPKISVNSTRRCSAI